MQKRNNNKENEDEVEERDENENENENEDEDELVRNISATESLLLRAKKHVKEYRIQKKHAALYISLAKLDILYLLPSLFRRKVLTIDMGQNLALPNFEGEQPGKPSIIFCIFVLF